MVRFGLLIFWLEPDKWTPHSMANDVLQHKEGLPLLLRCFKTLGVCIGRVWEASSGTSKHLRRHSIPKRFQSFGILFWQEHLVFGQSQPSGTLLSWPMVCCNMRVGTHCFWVVSKHLVNIQGRYKKLPLAPPIVWCITRFPNGYNLWAHVLGKASQVGPS